ncbi:MAP2K6 [Bugula neritina]|uniref:mitogen-activated protein kinase kinase n=1 Tax=Bugula neritina TaxID=10212 RepID=A0A7J7JYC6_BUGNE|nr:MAP2K6 [Bugula neritina]
MLSTLVPLPEELATTISMDANGPIVPNAGDSPAPSSAGRKARKGPKLLQPLVQEPPKQVDRTKLPGSNTTITIGSHTIECEADHLEQLEELGRGAFGVVEKMRHTPSGTIMAVKRIRATVNNKEEKRMLMDLDVSMRSRSCNYTVHFYGAMFREGDVWICMEVMDCSLDKFYKRVFSAGETIPEPCLANISLSVSRQGIEVLQRELNVMHRDVKPSNILASKKGEIKLCDFGISGQLIDSVAKTADAGCKPYMAPERINPPPGCKGFDIRSDIWSLGISMIEISTGVFPYSHWPTPFEQLRQVVHDHHRSYLTLAFHQSLCSLLTAALQKILIKDPTTRRYSKLTCCVLLRLLLQIWLVLLLMCWKIFLNPLRNLTRKSSSQIIRVLS